MFLYEQLLKACEDADVSSQRKVNELNKLLCTMCEDYYRARINPTTSKKEAKVIIDRTFNSFDLFVSKALMSNNRKLILLGSVFEDHSFRKQFMNNEKLKNLYDQL